MKKKGFTLIEVLAALALVSLLVVLLAATLGGSFTQFQILSRRKDRWLRAERAMESALAYEAVDEEGIEVKVSSYSENLEQVEVIDEQDKAVLFQALRPKESLYTP